MSDPEHDFICYRARRRFSDEVEINEECGLVTPYVSETPDTRLSLDSANKPEHSSPTLSKSQHWRYPCLALDFVVQVGKVAVLIAILLLLSFTATSSEISQNLRDLLSWLVLIMPF